MKTPGTFPRVAGTFKEREGFHGCQMPEQLLGRIIKVASNPGEVVLDPFSGSATTLTVAKKLGRQFIGFDISQEYIARGLRDLPRAKPGIRSRDRRSQESAPPRRRYRGNTKKRNVTKKKASAVLTLQFEPPAIESKE